MCSLDFILSTAHCYLQMTMLQYYESPTCLIAVLSELDPSDLFHLVYSTVMTIIHNTYKQQLPANCLIDFTLVSHTNQTPRQLVSHTNQTPRPMTQLVEKCSIQ